MPSHIYLRTGDFDEAAKSNDLAVIADRNYIQKSGSGGIYPLMYYNHNLHMLAASHIGNGNYAAAIKAARDLEANVSPNVAAMPMLEMFMPYPLVTLVRFHRSDEILKYPQPAPTLKATNGYWRLARGLALAETGKAADAEKELLALRELAASLPADAQIGNSPATMVMKAADEMLAGEIAVAKGDKAGIDSLRRAVAVEDLINYNEPPDLDIPIREWLGRALMRSGRYADAEAVYREELTKHPRNGRALFGLAEALDKQGNASATGLVRKEFESAWANADEKLKSADLFQSPAKP
jgi:Flp pilus assembly protein TadD